MATTYRAVLGALGLLVCFALCASGSEPDAAATPSAKAKKIMGADFPQLSREREEPTNGTGSESDFSLLWVSNSRLLEQLHDYTPESVIAEFGHRMEMETDIHMKMLLGAVMAEYGDMGVRKFIQGLSQNTDYQITMSRISAIGFLLRLHHPPDWVFDAAHDTLNDTRKVTWPEKANWSSGNDLEVWYIADEISDFFGKLTWALGDAKNPKSVPVLIEMAKRTHGSRGPVTALGLIGDPRGIPICMQFLKQQDASIKKHDSYSQDWAPSNELLEALANLRAKEAVPILLNYLFSPKVIAALGPIGDERAIIPLKKIVANHGKVKVDPYHWENIDQQREFAAKMALTKLEKDDPYPTWFAMMEDQSLDWDQRREAVWELGDHPDPRAIPHLIQAIKSDPKGEMVNQCTTVLTVYKYKAAVSGLIECFDADFKGKSDWKRAGSPEMFCENIGETLKTLTGQDFGRDKTRWLAWWQAEGSHLDSLK